MESEKATRKGRPNRIGKNYLKKVILGIGIVSLLILGVFIYLKAVASPLEIYHYVLRDRIIVTDQVLMRKTLYVSFRMRNRIEIRDGIKVSGKLLVNGTLISEANSMNTFEESFGGGNLAFLLPYQIEKGCFTVEICILNRQGELLADASAHIDRSKLKNTFPGKNGEKEKPSEEPIPQYPGVELSPQKGLNELGYSIASSSPLEYIFQSGRVHKGEANPQIFIETVKNKYEPFTLSLFAFQNLGEVKITVKDLVGKKGIISKENIQVGWVESVEETYGLPEGKYLRVPALIRPGDQIRIDKGEVQRIWITIRIGQNVVEGDYFGTVLIDPEKGKRKAVPIKITVYPIVLEDIPGKDFFMLMTYEFTELTNPWSEEEKRRIYEAGSKILKNYKDHGMTTLCFHSPFVLMTHENGKPNLDDIFAGLKAAKENGFERPIIWYMGHLIQTAKPKHPGNIIGFDREIHLRRLDYLIREVTNFAERNDFPEVIFLPIDEADDSFQDYENRRRKNTSLLLQEIAKNQAKSLLTGTEYGELGPVDYFCSSQHSPSVKKTVQQEGKRFWGYNNEVTTVCRNPAYARYIYGYYVWKHGLDGMASWTFQNTQNASGNPTLADGDGMDLYLAYPDPNGPLNTVKWEAIREGIDDHKLIYQLEKRIKGLREMGISYSKYKNFLDELREKNGEPPCQLEWTEEWNPSYFQKTKRKIISLILEAEQKMAEKKERIGKCGCQSGSLRGGVLDGLIPSARNANMPDN